METLKILCDPCSRKNISSDPVMSSSKNVSSYSVLYCYECKQYFCQQCVRRHTFDVTFSQHNLTDIGTLLFIANCSKHNDSALSFYCVEHDCLCCQFCISDKHFCCQTLLPLVDAATDVKQSVGFEHVANALSNIKTKLNEVTIILHENGKSLNNDEHTILKQIAICKDGIMKRLNELEDETGQDGHSLKNIQKAKLESNYSRVLQIAKPIHNISDQIRQISMYGSQTQMFVLINKCKSEILHYERSLQKLLPTLLNRTLRFQPPDNIHGVSLGSFRLNLTQKDLNYKPNYKQAQIPICVSDTTKQFTLVHEIEISNSGNVWISNMGITDDNRLLLCNNNGTSLLVYKDSGEYIQDCKLADNPWDITVMPGEDKAVVTLPLQKSIQFINTKTLIAQPKHSIPGPCYGITTVNDKICVGGTQKKLYILDKKGEHINTVMVPVTYSIDYLQAGPCDSVYYTDFTYNAVGCVTLDGKQRFRYTSNYLDRPRGVIADEKGNLYVSSQGSQSIRRLTPNGEFIDVILNKESISSIQNLLGMVFSNDYRQLFVSSHMNGLQDVLVFSCP